MPQSIEKQIGTLAPVEAELHLREISGEMFGADFVPRPNNSALEKRERRFNRVRVNVTVNVNALRVIDRLVLAAMNASVNHRFRVGREIIGHNHINVSRDVWAEKLDREITATMLHAEVSGD